MKTDEQLKWKTLKSEYLFRRPWLTARRDSVMLPDGRVNNEYYVLEYPDWVNVIAITKEGKFVMERQYRHGTQEVSTEICAGVMEKGETPLQAAQRELKEETGFAGGRWSLLMKAAPNPSSMSNHQYSFLAEDVEPTGHRHLDPTEDIEVMLVDRSQVRSWLEEGRLVQALMCAPLWKYFATH